MTYDKFVGEVQDRAKLDSQDDALRAIRATLQSLAEKLESGEATDLALQLPSEFEIYFQVPKHGVSMSLNDFFQRVRHRQRIILSQSVFHARVVMEVLQEAVPAEQIDHVIAQMPEDWRPLFESGSRGELRQPAAQAT